jgi:DNA-3-methyladenine glycosylase II
MSTRPAAQAKARQRRRRTVAAITALSAADPRMAALIDGVGPFHPVITPDPFETLASAILQQQISMKAAAAIQRRIELLCHRRRLRPGPIAGLTLDELRAAGVSRQKAIYLHGLAEAFASGLLSRRKLDRMDDEQVIAAVTELHGIGRWTAEMLLIFCLERPDVWPIDDLGLQHAVARFIGQKSLPSARTMRRAGEPFRPYRSYASWYLWRLREGDGMPGVAVPVPRVSSS